MTVSLEKNPSIKWTVSVHPSVVELKQNKAWEFLKGSIIYNVVRYEDTELSSHKMLSYYTVSSSS